MMFYLYTGMIDFAPPRSFGIQERKQYIAEYVRAHPLRAAPCSSKSMFRLADKVSIT